MKTDLILTLAAMLLMTAFSCDKGKDDQEEEQPAVEDAEVQAYGAASWTAEYADGEYAMDNSSAYPDRKGDRYVGIFYFVWQGAHGYDVGDNSNADNPQTPSSTDVNSPYDVTEILNANPDNPQWGPVKAFHYWGKPYFDYYVGEDEWVMRRHAQMLSDAGVDVIFIDVTNSFIYKNTVNKLCKLYVKMRNEGNPTPQVSFLVNGSAVSTVSNLYEEYYSNSDYRQLWFQWEGKPLLLAPYESYDAEISNYFTMRSSWSRQDDKAWFGDGEGKWPWCDTYPQEPGLKDGKPEEICVMPATHPVKTIGRSHDASSQPSISPDMESSSKGTYFKLQCERALEVDPPFVFITGWNEWIAQRMVNGVSGCPWSASFVGKNIGEGDTYFTDQYNYEYSRDIEPAAGGFTDNYYYYMVDFIRKYKGIDRPEAVTEQRSISIDGKMSDWAGIGGIADDANDTEDRDCYGFGSVGQLTNYTGRNDIVLTKVASDASNLYFYARTAENLSSYKGSNWMRLFIGVDGSSVPDWEGFNYVVNRTVTDEATTTLQKSAGGYKWEEAGSISYSVSGNEMEIAVPLKDIGITNPDSFAVTYKWMDNCAGNGDIRSCMKNGDAAPNARFRYTYTFKK